MNVFQLHMGVIITIIINNANGWIEALYAILSILLLFNVAIQHINCYLFWNKLFDSDKIIRLFHIEVDFVLIIDLYKTLRMHSIHKKTGIESIHYWTNLDIEIKPEKII